ncbi:MAG TPA: tetratricopeptide repeat protein [Gemmatimonadales bacterium]|nr:tetratricopeptide repeat protein [Gemmatimonadales bacterium]
MKTYTSRDVADILGMTVREVQVHGRAGYLSPDRGPGNRYRFSFQDLILLRTAKGLTRANLPPARIRSVLRKLRGELPRGRSLSEVRVGVAGDEIVVNEGGAAWSPESGQIVFDFAVADLAKSAAPFARRGVESARKADHARSADDWFDLGTELEATAPNEARDAYRRALELNPAHADAHVNLGRLLQEEGATQAAVEQYRAALETDARHATAAFNLGSALEALGRRREAIAAYQKAIAADPDFADAHYNLSRLYERSGKKQAAIRHLARYKALVDNR